MNKLKFFRGGNGITVTHLFNVSWNRNVENTKCNSYIKTL